MKRMNQEEKKYFDKGDEEKGIVYSRNSFEV